VTDALGRFVFQGSPRQRYCQHLDMAADFETADPICPKCVAPKRPWVHVRMCLICGERGCCDSSSGKHARQHFEETGHPLIRSIEPGERWGWCYVDKVYLRGPDFLA
jgi:uncharacterized UBP type Zn finger protein